MPDSTAGLQKDSEIEKNLFLWQIATKDFSWDTLPQTDYNLTHTIVRFL